MKVMPNPLFICIIGVDGSGKTTQANMLVDRLRKEGLRCRYAWFRFYHFTSLPLLAYARLMGLSEMKTLKSGRKIGYHYFYRSKVVSTLYPFFLFIDTLIFIIIKIYIPRRLFKTGMVCDRFIYDTIVDLMISTGDSNIHRSKIGRLFLRLMPRNMRALMLKVNEPVLRERREDVKWDKTLNKRIEYYDRLSKDFYIPVIDASPSVEEVHEELVRKLGEVRCLNEDISKKKLKDLLRNYPLPAFLLRTWS